MTEEQQIQKDEFLTSKEAEEYLKVSSVTLWRLVKEGLIPIYKIHNRNRYRRSDLENFMESHKVSSANTTPVSSN